MAIINKTGITTGGTIQAEHVTRAIDALSGGSTDSVIATGSFSGSFTGELTGTASFATTASYALNAGVSSIQTSGSTLYSSNPATSVFSTTNGIFLGGNAGNGATGAFNSNFLGINAGSGSFGASNSNFLGSGAGGGATDADNSNFLGINAGRNAIVAKNSNFLGRQAGQNATNANNSNFLGQNAGNNATNASYSNFLGLNAGSGATNANNSNFLGQNAGQNATNASNSTLIGFNIGQSGSWGSIGTNNIIIGTNITLPDTSRDSINIGGIIFGTGSYGTTTGNPYTGSQSAGRIGIAKVTPNATLDVAGNTIISGSLTVTGSFVQRTNSGQLLITSDTNSTMSINHDVLNLSSEEVNVTNDVYFGERGGLDLTAMKNFMGLRIPLDPPSTGLTTTGSLYFDAPNLTLYIHDGTQWTYITLGT
jgi:hypothetical protein